MTLNGVSYTKPKERVYVQSMTVWTGLFRSSKFRNLALKTTLVEEPIFERI